MVGNRVVARLLQANVQRVTVDASTAETLYNTEAASGQATPGHFSVSGNYELTRQEDNGAAVKVKIRFLSQSRNTTPPVPPATTPRVGQLVGPRTEIPPGDTRRDWASRTMTAALTNWNGRLTFVGQEAPAGDAAGAPLPKRLPVTFEAEPVWTEADPANATVIVHPSSVIGGSTGNPIDAGNFYEQRDAKQYPAEENVIYAHEYGHLLGIPDEYSQSNRQMHLLLHQASPTGADTAMAALDRATVERMVLAAVSRPLYAQLTAAMPAVVAAFRAAQPKVTQKMTEALRAGVRDDAVVAALRTRLEQSSADALHPSVPRVAAFQTSTNFSPRGRAVQTVGAQFAGPALTSRIADAYWTALQAPHEQNVAVEGLGDVRINPSTSVYGLGQGTGPVAAPAAALANTAVSGAASTPAAAIPRVAPPASLVGQLRALPATWGAAGSAVESAITPEAITSRLTANLEAANLAALIAPVIPGIVTQPRVQQIGALYRRALQIVSDLTTAAGKDIINQLLSTQIAPILQSSVTTFQSSIHTEVERLMNTPAGTLAASTTPDPNMAAMVAGMKARLDAAKTATASSNSRDPLGAGEVAPDQDVTYSYQGLMGSNTTTAMRPDQFGPMVRQFNDHFKKPLERDFTAETR